MANNFKCADSSNPYPKYVAQMLGKRGEKFQEDFEFCQTIKKFALKIQNGENVAKTEFELVEFADSHSEPLPEYLKKYYLAKYQGNETNIAVCPICCYVVSTEKKGILIYHMMKHEESPEPFPSDRIWEPREFLGFSLATGKNLSEEEWSNIQRHLDDPNSTVVKLENFTNANRLNWNTMGEGFRQPVVNGERLNMAVCQKCRLAVTASGMYLNNHIGSGICKSRSLEMQIGNPLSCPSAISKNLSEEEWSNIQRHLDDPNSTVVKLENFNTRRLNWNTMGEGFRQPVVNGERLNMAVCQKCRLAVIADNTYLNRHIGSGICKKRSLEMQIGNPLSCPSAISKNLSDEEWQSIQKHLDDPNSTVVKLENFTNANRLNWNTMGEGFRQPVVNGERLNMAVCQKCRLAVTASSPYLRGHIGSGICKKRSLEMQMGNPLSCPSAISKNLSDEEWQSIQKHLDDPNSTVVKLENFTDTKRLNWNTMGEGFRQPVVNGKRLNMAVCQKCRLAVTASGDYLRNHIGPGICKKRSLAMQKGRPLSCPSAISKNFSDEEWQGIQKHLDDPNSTVVKLENFTNANRLNWNTMGEGFRQPVVNGERLNMAVCQKCRLAVTASSPYLRGHIGSGICKKRSLEMQMGNPLSCPSAISKNLSDEEWQSIQKHLDDPNSTVVKLENFTDTKRLNWNTMGEGFRQPVVNGKRLNMAVCQKCRLAVAASSPYLKCHINSLICKKRIQAKQKGEPYPKQHKKQYGEYCTTCEQYVHVYEIYHHRTICFSKFVGTSPPTFRKVFPSKSRDEDCGSSFEESAFVHKIDSTLSDDVSVLEEEEEEELQENFSEKLAELTDDESSEDEDDYIEEFEFEKGIDEGSKSEALGTRPYFFTTFHTSQKMFRCGSLKESRQKDMYCYGCNAYYKSGHYYDTHILECIEEPPGTFSEFVNFADHLELPSTHQNANGRYECPWKRGCKKSFIKKSGLRLHWQLHTGEKPFDCQESTCHKAFRLRQLALFCEVSHSTVTKEEVEQLINDRASSCSQIEESRLTFGLLSKRHRLNRFFAHAIVDEKKTRFVICRQCQGVIDVRAAINGKHLCLFPTNINYPYPHKSITREDIINMARKNDPNLSWKQFDTSTNMSPSPFRHAFVKGQESNFAGCLNCKKIYSISFVQNRGCITCKSVFPIIAKVTPTRERVTCGDRQKDTSSTKEPRAKRNVPLPARYRE